MLIPKGGSEGKSEENPNKLGTYVWEHAENNLELLAAVVDVVVVATEAECDMVP